MTVARFSFWLMARPATQERTTNATQTALNVVVTAAGRRTSLVRAFVEATRDRGGSTYAADVDGLAPALFVADGAIQCVPTGDPEFIPQLVENVRGHGIRLLVPTIDTDLPILAASRPAFERVGCRVAVSSAAFVDITLDKAATAAEFGSAGIAVPATWRPPIDTGVLPADLFVKPRRGSASKDVHRTARADLDRILPLVPDPVVQEALSGPEITIDALLDFEGRPIHYVPRYRLKTVGGELVQGVTLDHDPELETWIEQVLDAASAIGAAGPLTIQAFLTPRGPVLTEINPRFGGGLPLALAAGAESPAWLLDMVAGTSVAPRLRAYEPGVFMTRSLVEHFVRRPLW